MSSNIEFAVILLAIVALCLGAAGIIVTLIIGTDSSNIFDEAQARREAEELLKNINKPTISRKSS